MCRTVRGKSHPLESVGPALITETLVSDIRSATRHAFLLYRHRASSSEIEDVCHDIILLLMDDDYRRLRSFDSEKSSMRHWLSIVVTRHVINCLHRHKGTESLDEISSDSMAYEPPQEVAAIWLDRQERLRAAIAKLTVRERQLLDNLFKNGDNVAEIATSMGVKMNSVYRRKHAIIKKLRKLLDLPSA